MKTARLGDGALAALLGAALFAVAAAPYLLVRQPPLQDYAEHVAAAAMASRAGDYPEYVFNGLLKTNSAFTGFVWLAGRAIGLERAGFVFVLLVLAANAFALTRFVLHFGGRARLQVATLFALPFVHNWFVSMGMLNFSLGVSLSLASLIALDAQRVAPSVPRATLAGGALLATWYAHPVPVLAVGLIVAAQVVSRPTRAELVAEARALLPPHVPVVLAVAASILVHLRDTARLSATGSATSFQTPLWLAYDLWAHWGYGYTVLSLASLPLAGALALFAAGRVRAPIPFFGPCSLLVLAVAYLAAPYQTVGLGYAGSRIIPYLWMAALVRVPERLGGALAAALALASGLYAAGMAVDTVRLSREEDEFAAGTGVVARGTRLDVFIFSPRLTSRNTWSLSTAWGEYVTRSGARTWEMPGDTPSLPFHWRAAPPARLETSAHHRFMDLVRTEQTFCASREASGLGPGDCGRLWRDEWASYYREVDPFIDAILMWDPPQDSRDRVPSSWTPALHSGRLWIFERRASGQQADLDVDPPGGAPSAR
jgi:hypothetical protein